jgi:cell division protein FtsB
VSELAWPVVALLAVVVVSRAAVKAVAVQNGQSLADNKALKARLTELEAEQNNLSARVAVLQSQTTAHALALGFKSPGAN